MPYLLGLSSRRLDAEQKGLGVARETAFDTCAVVNFGTKRMYWARFTDRHYEDMHYSEDVSSGWNLLEKTSFDTPKNWPSWWRFYWYQIVSTYTAATLTFNSDRFLALAALVRLVQPKIDDG